MSGGQEIFENFYESVKKLKRLSGNDEEFKELLFKMVSCLDFDFKDCKSGCDIDYHEKLKDGVYVCKKCGFLFPF